MILTQQTSSRFISSACAKPSIAACSFDSTWRTSPHIMRIATTNWTRRRCALPFVPRVTSRRRASSGGEKALPARPLAGELWIVGVTDLPTAIRMLKPDDLQALSIDVDQALAKAQDNTRLDLKKSIADLQRAATTDRVIGLTGNSYMSSLLAFDDVWTNVAKSMDGHLVAMAPGPRCPARFTR